MRHKSKQTAHEVLDYILENWFAIVGTLISIGLIVHAIASDKPNIANPAIHYVNVDCKIVQFGSESKLSDDKFHRPELCKSVLFQMQGDTTMYWEYNTCSDHDADDININTAWFYNHRVGDVIHFEYLAKTRFFKINPR